MVVLVENLICQTRGSEESSDNNTEIIEVILILINMSYIQDENIDKQFLII